MIFHRSLSEESHDLTFYRTYKIYNNLASFFMALNQVPLLLAKWNAPRRSLGVMTLLPWPKGRIDCRASMFLDAGTKVWNWRKWEECTSTLYPSLTHGSYAGHCSIIWLFNAIYIYEHLYVCSRGASLRLSILTPESSPWNTWATMQHHDDDPRQTIDLGVQLPVAA